MGSAFIDILNSIGVKQQVSGPTHCRNHTLDLILSHGIDVNGVEILQQSDGILDHYLVSCIFHIAKAVKPTPCYKYMATAISPCSPRLVVPGWETPGKTRLLLEEVLVRPAGGAHTVFCVGPNAPV